MVNCSKCIRLAFVLVAMSIAWGPGPAPADAAVRDCSVYDEVPNRALSHAGVTSVRNLSCRSARRAIRRYGRHQTSAAYRDAGSRFGLGPWSCTVYYHNYELWKARCVRGTKAFRVEYGF